MIKFIVLALIFIPNLVFAQETLNLDFEYALPNTSVPLKWRILSSGYQTELDSKEKYSSFRSLRMKSQDSTVNQPGGFANSLPVHLFKDKHIVFKGKIKTHALKNGYAGLWWRVDGVKEALKVDDMADRGVRGTQDWTDASIKMQIPAEATYINFGAVVSGQGTAWFDKFEIWIDGEKLIDLPPRLTPPTDAELVWLKKYVYPLKTVEPNTVVNQDLTILKKLIGEAKVVALGEVSHGSREIFKMKHRLVKYLAENQNFDVFSIEASMPEAYRINEYTTKEKGNPSNLIKDMHFWAWSTQEVLDLVEWMKTENQAKAKMQFTGFDMQNFYGPMQELDLAFQDQPDVFKNISRLKKEFETVTDQTNTALIHDVLPEKIVKIESIINYFKKSVASAALSKSKEEWLLQNIRLLEQFLDKSYIFRDKYMAENLLWIKAQQPNSKIAAWAHNAHIKKSEYSMGKYLADSLGKDYLTIGFAFHEGNYTAVGDHGLTSYQAQVSPIGTYEYFFQALNEPIFILDLRTAKRDKSAEGQWLRQKLAFRTVGSTKMAYEFTETNITDDFDLLIFIKETSSSVLLK